MKIVLIDYGMGNLGSVRRAAEECGASCLVTGDPHELKGADGILLPGVGSFREGMENLRSRGLAAALTQAAKDTPILGICLGMQLLADQGEEGGSTAGLSLIAGEVKRLAAPCTDERIPHVGWNQVISQGDQPLFEGVPAGTDFYFVHSYHFMPSENASIAAKTPYCGKFVSAVRCGQVYGVQFHPEKSAKGGFRLLRNFFKLCVEAKPVC